MRERVEEEEPEEGRRLDMAGKERKGKTRPRSVASRFLIEVRLDLSRRLESIFRDGDHTHQEQYFL